jgi:diguanylate cyclase (GGDEF)-like protein
LNSLSADFAVGESDRLRAVRRYEILDTPPEETFNRIAALTARILRVPIAIISIVDSDRVWFMSSHGIDVRQIPRNEALCASAILHPTPWIVNDATLDPLTLSHPWVTGQIGLRFYAAVALTTNDGYNLGTLCVIDKQPRQISHTDVAILHDLAALVMHQMELRLDVRCALKMDDTILQRSQREKQHAEYLAKHDALTGLGNRRKFDDAFSIELNRLRRHGGRLCVMMVDIDHFKQINDRHGHIAGDEVLATFSELLGQKMRPTDTVARIGGEEFIVLMPHTRVWEAWATAERLRTVVADQTIISLQTSITVSIGVAELQDDEDKDSLLRRADLALYRAKRSGRNQTLVAGPNEGIDSIQTL